MDSTPSRSGGYREVIERTDDSSMEGRWITVVLRDEYENAKQWIEEIICHVPELMSEMDNKIFKAKYEIFPPALFSKTPLGG